MEGSIPAAEAETLASCGDFLTLTFYVNDSLRDVDAEPFEILVELGAYRAMIDPKDELHPWVWQTLLHGVAAQTP